MSKVISNERIETLAAGLHAGGAGRPAERHGVAAAGRGADRPVSSGLQQRNHRGGGGALLHGGRADGDL